MAIRVGPITVDSKTVAAALTPEVLTADDVPCTSVYVVAAEANTGAQVYVVDNVTTANKIRVPAGGITLPISNPKLVTVDVDTSGDIVEWMAM